MMSGNTTSTSTDPTLPRGRAILFRSLCNAAQRLACEINPEAQFGDIGAVRIYFRVKNTFQCRATEKEFRQNSFAIAYVLDVFRRTGNHSLSICGPGYVVTSGAISNSRTYG